MLNYILKQTYDVKYAHNNDQMHTHMAQESEMKYFGVTTLLSLQEFCPQNLSKQLMISIPHIRLELPSSFLGLAISP